MYNEELGCYEWKEVETDKYVFDETDKIAIAREYHERRCPASDIVSKYHILHRQKRSDCPSVMTNRVTIKSGQL